MDIKDLSDLVEIHGNTVYGFCHRLAKNKTDTDDLYQETFLKALEICHKIDKNNNPKGFLISIAVGIWKNNQRKYSRRKRIAPVEKFNEDAVNDHISNSESTPEDAAISNEFKAMIQAAADTLTAKLKIPLYMYYTAEMSYEDIASSLKIPQGTVKSRLYKARNALKSILETEVGEYEKI